MKKTLIVVDMQNDFIDGSLGTDEARAIVGNVKKRLNYIGPLEMRLSLQGILMMKIILIHLKVRNCRLSTA